MNQENNQHINDYFRNKWYTEYINKYVMKQIYSYTCGFCHTYMRVVVDWFMDYRCHYTKESIESVAQEIKTRCMKCGVETVLVDIIRRVDG